MGAGMNNHLANINKLSKHELTATALANFAKAVGSFTATAPGDIERLHAMHILAHLLDMTDRLLDPTFTGPKRWRMEASLSVMAMQLYAAVETPTWMR
jgi:hypothetical protein